MKKYTMLILLYVVLITTALFDPNGAKYGYMFMADIPQHIQTFFQILGSILWIYGAFLAIVTIFIGGVSFATLANAISIKNLKPFKPEDKSKLEDFTNNKWNSVKSSMTRRLSIATSILLISSGFWFTGSSLLLLIINVYIFRQVVALPILNIIDQER